ncbi:MAG: TonB-dependent siderophore receptor [Gammaproteobacteria bacterium]|nr:TonB-dependent siderophore receptor [Gammaproteobacteria bacterium]
MRKVTKHISKPVALAFAAALTIPYAAPVAAETAPTSDERVVEEVFVIGKRRAYQGNFDSLEKPSADQTIAEDLLREAGAINLNDALDLSASVARQNNFGGLWNAFSVRGFAGDINLPSGFLVNGFNAGRGFAGPRDLAGIESVEVLKGPRSALFGRGEPGGTVNLVTKRPQFERTGNLRATYGRWDQMRFEGDVQTTAGTNDELGLRMVGFYEDAESFRDTVETERLGLYPSITWDVSDATSVTYELEFTEQEIPFDRGVAYSEDFGFTPRETFVGEPGDGPIETEVLGHQLEAQHNFSDNWSLLAGLGYRDTSFEGNASETNFGGRQTYFLDGRTLSRFFRYRNFESDYLVARMEVAGEFNTGSLRHRLLVGGDYDRFELDWFILRYRPGWFPGTTDINTLDPAEYLFLDVFNPRYGQSPQPVPGPNTHRKEDLEGRGVYIQDQIDITDRVQVRLGLRWDDFEQDLTNLRAVPARTTSSSDTRVSPQFGVVYSVNEGVSLYASYGEGFRQQAGSDYQGRQFAPNITESAEIGLKFDAARFSETVSGALTFSLFQVDQSNILVNDDRPEAVAVGWFSRDAGKARSRGFEVDADLAFETGFNLWLSYAYIDAVFTTSNLEADWGVLIEDGDPLINSPEHQVSLQVSQSFEVGGMPAQVGAGLQYTDERLGFTAFDFYLPSYNTARLFGLIQPTERVAVRFDLDNAFDEEYYTNSYADVWVEPGAPRRYRLTASYSF